MGDETSGAPLQASKRTLMIVWFAFLAEPLIYALLPWVVSAEQVGGFERGMEFYWKWGSYLLAVVLAVASLLLSRFLLSDRQIEARLQAGQLESDGLSASKDLSAQESQLLSVSRYYLNSMLLSWGLNSFVPVGGLILLFTGGDCRTILVLSALAVVLNLLAYPQLDAFVERVRNLVEG